jgi:hypothetical protein
MTTLDDRTSDATQTEVLVGITVTGADEVAGQPLRFAATVTGVLEVTGADPSVTLAEICPAGMTTAAPTSKTGLLASRFTSTPPSGAGAVRATVTIRPFPPATVEDAGLTPATQTPGPTLTGADTAPHAPTVAEISAVMPAAAAVAVIGKLTEVCPAGTVTVSSPGTETCEATWTSGVLLSRFTTSPPAGAAPFNCSVPVTMFPSTTASAERFKLMRQGGFKTRPIILVTSPRLDDTFALRGPATAVAFTVKAADAWPAATVTVDGTCIAGRLLVSATTAPPTGAGELNVTVPLICVPLLRDRRETVKSARQAGESKERSLGASTTLT